jgi:hypothetical protein
VACAGLLVGWPAWIAMPIGATYLVCRGWGKYRELMPRVRALDTREVWRELMKCLALSALNGITAAVAAFGLGLGSKWLWG